MDSAEKMTRWRRFPYARARLVDSSALWSVWWSSSRKAFRSWLFPGILGLGVSQISEFRIPISWVRLWVSSRRHVVC